MISASWVALPFVEELINSSSTGYYNFTLTLNDASGNSVSDTVFVSILPHQSSSGSSNPSTASRFYITPTAIAITAGIVILGGFLLLMRRRGGQLS